MKIAIPKERRRHERRVAASPDTVGKLVGLGFTVAVEAGAGDASIIPDALFEDAGAAIAGDQAAVLADADIVLKVQRPLIPGDEAGDDSSESGDEIAAMKRGAILIGALEALRHADHIAAFEKAGLTTFSLELLPRITRAQSMDVLSSQSNIAGYKAVLDGAHEFARAFPMMMTAAGTIAPARVLILGAGVAGLQAIATARRLGAVVSAYDVRPAVKEQVESLGAKFVEVDAAATRDAETAEGYAKEMGEDYRRKQEQVLAETLAKQDIAICTALIPGRAAPVLITDDMVASMRPGSVIVDLAVEHGGNCTLSEYGEVVVRHGVTIVGHANVPSRLARDATAMYARNLLSFITPMVDGETGELAIDWDDEIIKACAITRDGALVHPSLEAPEAAAEAAS